MGDAEEMGEAAGVGSLSDAGAAEKDPLDVSVLGISTQSGGEGEVSLGRKR